MEGGLRDKVKECAKEAKLSKRLATIHTDVDLKVGWRDLSVRGPKEDELRRILKEFEFSALLSELAPREGIKRDKYGLVVTKKDLEGLCGRLKKAKRFAFDTETTSLDPMRAGLVGLSFAWAAGEAAYIPVGHTGLDSTKQLDLEDVIKHIRPILEDRSIAKIGQNCKYDMAVLAKYDVKVAPIECDTMIASYVLNPSGAHGLDNLAGQHLDHTTIKYKELTGKGKKGINFSDVDLERACIYSCEDADVTLRLANIFMPQLKEKRLKELFFDMEMPLMHVLLKMELSGVKIDAGLLKQMGRRFEGDLKRIEAEIFEEAGEKFNINSPKQLGLFRGQISERGGISQGFE